MKTFWKISLGILGMAALLVAFWQRAATQSGQDVLYLNGHTVQGAFLAYYNQLRDAELLLGPPLTEAFVQPRSGVRVQYFARGMLEEVNGEIRQADVGIVPSLTGVEVDTRAWNCELQNNFYICEDFLGFYQEYGGSRMFGNPLSATMLENGIYTQRFEKALFTWNPDGQTLTERVLLADLGRASFYVNQEDPARLLPLYYTNNLPEQVLENGFKTTHLQVFAFPATSAIVAGQSQAVYIIVLDENRMPVEGSAITYAVSHAGGQQETAAGFTNPAGIKQLVIETPAGQSGLVEVVVTASRDGLQKTTRTSFRLTP